MAMTLRGAATPDESQGYLLPIVHDRGLPGFLWSRTVSDAILLIGFVVALWALSSTGLGCLDGAVFEHEPLEGVACGLGLVLTAAYGAVRSVRHRSKGV
jgi:hypothetical protein